MNTHNGSGAQDLFGSEVTVTRTGATTGTIISEGQDITVSTTGASSGTVTSTGLDINVTGDTGGTSTAIGLDVNVSGADTNYAAIFQGGNVGIGTAAPAYSLEVVGGDAFFQDNVRVGSATPSVITLNGNDLFVEGQLEAAGAVGSFIENLALGSYSPTGNSGELVTSGNVGIGESSPSAALSVGSGNLFTVNSSGLVNLTNSASVELNFTGDTSASNIYTQDSLAIQIDTNDNGSENFRVYDGAGEVLITLEEGGQTTLGSATQDGTFRIYRDGFLANFVGTLTGAQIYTLPDATGEFCLSSGNCDGVTNFWNTDSNVVNLVTDGDVVTVGSASNLAKLAVDGDTAGEVQFLVQGAGSQSADILVIEDSTGTDYLAVQDDGDVYIENNLTLGVSTSSAQLTVNGEATYYRGFAHQFNAYYDGNDRYLETDSAFQIWHDNSTDELRFQAGGTGTQGNIISYADALVVEADGDVDIDSNTLFVDSTNNEVGIGTNSPDYELDVVGNIGLDEYIYHNDDSNTHVRFSDDLVRTYAGGVELIAAAPGQITLNEGGVDVNLNVEASGEANALFVEGSSGNVGIGTGAPGAKLEVDTDLGENAVGLLITQQDTGSNPDALQIVNGNSGDSIQVTDGSTEVFKILNGGKAQFELDSGTENAAFIGSFSTTSISSYPYVSFQNDINLDNTGYALRFLDAGGAANSSLGSRTTSQVGNTAELFFETGGTERLTVGDSLLTSSTAALFQNGSDSTTAFRISESTGAGGSDLLTADTQNFLLKVAPTQFLSSGSDQTFGSNGNITGVDQYSTIAVDATASSVTVTLPVPAAGGQVVGRIIYVTAVDGSNEFTLSLADTDGVPANYTMISMKENSTATLIWNGFGWTAAGASSSTDLQAAYNNTLSSAGGAEIVLNPSGGAADGLTIRNNDTTPIVGGILEVQSSIGTNLFSVNNLATELASNGGAEDSSSFSSDWEIEGSSDSVTRTTTSGEFVTGQAGVEVDTSTAADDGVFNNLASNPAVSTSFTVSFTAKLDSGTFTDLEVAYTPDNGTTDIPCDTNSYSTRTLATTGWTKITCTIDTDATVVTDPNLIIRQEAGGTGRVFWIDNLSFIQNDGTTVPDNVQIGGGINGGPVTLFTLDRASAPPVANGNDTYLGSMYYDTVTGRIQCYEADGWGACGSAPNNYVNLNPEYPGSVLNGSGVGTMTADFCAEEAVPTSVLNINTSFCDEGEARNYYAWTSPQATQQTYSIIITYQLPAEFGGFDSNSTVQLTARTDNTDNGEVTYEMFRNEGGAIVACGTETPVAGTNAPVTTADVWHTVGINGNEATGCGFSNSSADDFVIFKINMKANSNASVYASTLSFTTVGQ